MRDAVLVAVFRGDLIDTLIPVLFVAVWIISQVFAAFRNAAKQPQQPARPPRPVPPQPGPGRPPELDREIEEILRRTLGVEPGRQPSPPRPPKQPKQKQKPKKQAAPVLSGMSPRDGRGSRDDVARHVEEAFAHDLAHESPSGTAAQSVAAIAAAPSADLIASLRSPETLRQLMIVREILEVPTHRW
jgi:hypothetical protein